MTGHAIIGCGRVAPNHADGFTRLAGYPIRWACDRELASAKELAGQFGIPGVTEDHHVVLADPDVTSVSVAVDHLGHDELCAAALRAGKHVLVEKPIALSQRRGAELVELARSRNLVLSVVSQHRHDPVARAVRDWVREGLLGDLNYVAATVQAARDPDYYTTSYWRGTLAGEGGSALINQGYHAADMLVWLFGDVSSVAGGTDNVGKRGVIETEDTAAATVRFREGGLGVLAVTTGGTEFWRTRIEIVCTRGSVVFDLDHPNRLHSCTGSEQLLARAEALRESAVDEAAPGTDYYGVSHRRQIAEFAAAVRGGDGETESDALRTLELIQSVYNG